MNGVANCFTNGEDVCYPVAVLVLPQNTTPSWLRNQVGVFIFINM